MAHGDHCVGEIQLAVELERPRLNREGPRGRARLGGPVNDAHLTPSLVSQSAKTKPVGPAPTIRISQSNVYSCE